MTCWHRKGSFYILVKEEFDYQGRSWTHPPQDVGVSLKADAIPEKCFMPKRLIHTWAGHTKALSCIRWLPVSAHLLLSSGMDSKIKVSSFYSAPYKMKFLREHNFFCYISSLEHRLSLISLLCTSFFHSAPYKMSTSLASTPVPSVSLNFQFFAISGMCWLNKSIAR